jgi:cell filamentation protein
MDALFGVIDAGQAFADLDTQEFVGRLAGFLSELNAIHPFREGNGRAQLSFAGLIGATFGHPLHFERLNPERFLTAMVTSYSCTREPLIAELQGIADQ